MKIKVGTCGWGFFKPAKFTPKKKFSSNLQAYSSLFSLVEVNSTFYRIPKVKTAERWRKEVSREFEFTVKCSKIVTHEDRFSTGRSIEAFERIEEVAKVLKAKIILLQTPASFKPTTTNIRNLKSFLSTIDSKFLIAWEPRGNWDDKIIKEICEEFNLIHCVDPFRHKTQYFSKKKIAYLRLHGLGKPMMYRYKFSDEELADLKKIINKLKVKTVYVLFNNVYMYEDALRFMKILEDG